MTKRRATPAPRFPGCPPSTVVEKPLKERKVPVLAGGWARSRRWRGELTRSPLPRAVVAIAEVGDERARPASLHRPLRDAAAHLRGSRRGDELASLAAGQVRCRARLGGRATELKDADVAGAALARAGGGGARRRLGRSWRVAPPRRARLAGDARSGVDVERASSGRAGRGVRVQAAGVAGEKRPGRGRAARRGSGGPAASEGDDEREQGQGPHGVIVLPGQDRRRGAGSDQEPRVRSGAAGPIRYRG